MSYERKDEIIMNLKDYNAGRKVVTGGTNAFESKLSELDEVYAKAEAFDVVIEIQKNTINRFKQLIDSTDDLYFKDRYQYSIERAEDIIEALRSQLT